MSSNQTEGTNIANALYNASISTVLAVGFAQIVKQLRGGAWPRLDLSGNDLAMTALDISSAVVTKI